MGRQCHCLGSRDKLEDFETGVCPLGDKARENRRKGILEHHTFRTMRKINHKSLCHSLIKRVIRKPAELLHQMAPPRICPIREHAVCAAFRWTHVSPRGASVTIITLHLSKGWYHVYPFSSPFIGITSRNGPWLGFAAFERPHPVIFGRKRLLCSERTYLQGKATN